MEYNWNYSDSSAHLAWHTACHLTSFGSFQHPTIWVFWLDPAHFSPGSTGRNQPTARTAEERSQNDSGFERGDSGGDPAFRIESSRCSIGGAVSDGKLHLYKSC